MHRILICDPLHAAAFEIFEQAGVETHRLTDEERPRLAELIGDYDALVVRSATKVTADLLAAGSRLKVVGRAGIGVDNVDVAKATELGILVVNAPTANLISATEHSLALLLALARRVPPADRSLKEGAWDRKGHVGSELMGKTLGVIGLGRIGQQVAARAKAFEMEVLAFDPFLDKAVAERLGVEPVTLDELLARADAVTVHTPLTDGTRGLLDAAALAKMKPGAFLVNCARGGIIDEPALLAALDEDRLGGAALDVFAHEPPDETALALIRHPKVVATPHIGAQTHEAQERIATQTAKMLLAALDGSLSVTAVNLPFRAAAGVGELYFQLAERLGRLASGLLGGSLSRLEVELSGIEESLRLGIRVAALKGALGRFLGEAVNYVNAENVAADRGIKVVTSTHSVVTDYPHLIGVKVEGPEGAAVGLEGTLYGGRDARVVRVGGFQLEFPPDGPILVLRNRDVPGVVGMLGTQIGKRGVNIAGIHLARQSGTQEALAALQLDTEPPAELLAELGALEPVFEVHYIDMR